MAESRRPGSGPSDDEEQPPEGGSRDTRRYAGSTGVVVRGRGFSFGGPGERPPPAPEPAAPPPPSAPLPVVGADGKPRTVLYGPGVAREVAAEVARRMSAAAADPASHAAPRNDGTPPITVLPAGSRQVLALPNALVPVSAAPRALEPIAPPPASRRRRAGAPADIIAVKAPLPEDPDRRLAVLGDQESTRAVAYRSLRQRLVDGGDPRVVLIASALDGEGTTSCAANLALVLADLQRYSVLLLELNAKRPGLAELFGLPQPRCVLRQMADHRVRPDAAWEVVELEPLGLHVLAAAREPDAADGRLHGPTVVSAIDRLAVKYDYVIIDGGSLLGGHQVQLVEDAADAVVLVARARTRARHVRAALEQIPSARCAGVVLMDT